MHSSTSGAKELSICHLHNVLVFAKLFAYCFTKYSHLSNKREFTLTDFEKKIHPPRLFISQIYSTLHSSFIAFMYYFFSKKSHPPRLFQPPQLLEKDESTYFSTNRISLIVFHIMDHPFKTSAYFRVGGVKNWPNLPTVGGSKSVKLYRRLKCMVLQVKCPNVQSIPSGGCTKFKHLCMSLAAHQFGRVEFRIYNIEYLF